MNCTAVKCTRSTSVLPLERQVVMGFVPHVISEQFGRTGARPYVHPGAPETIRGKGAG